jgi:protein-tyrosine phosphatase
VYAPNHDNGDNPLNPERLKIALDAARRVQSAVKNELKVLVTCRAGMNRSGLVTALALHFLYGWDGDTCIRRVRLKRHRWKGYQPLSNPDFTQTLRRIQSRALSKPPSGWQEGPGGILIPS